MGPVPPLGTLGLLRNQHTLKCAKDLYARVVDFCFDFYRKIQRPGHFSNCSCLFGVLDVLLTKSKFVAQVIVVVTFFQLRRNKLARFSACQARTGVPIWRPASSLSVALLFGAMVTGTRAKESRFV